MSDLSNHIILAIDNEQDNLEVFKATLEMLYGAVVHVELSGQEALSSLSRIQPTVIVTDLSMPNMDGYVLLRQLRNRADTATLPIIAITAHAMGGDRDRILEAGFDGYISKPFDITSLGEQIESCLLAVALKMAQVHQTIQAEVQKLNTILISDGEKYAVK